MVGSAGRKKTSGEIITAGQQPAHRDSIATITERTEQPYTTQTEVYLILILIIFYYQIESNGIDKTNHATTKQTTAKCI